MTIIIKIIHVEIKTPAVFLDVNTIDNDQINFPSLNFQKKRKKMIYGRGLDMSLISKSILNQPSYLES